MSKTKIGVFSILAFGIMMLLIPATSIASAAEYDKYYKEKDRYGKDYGYGYDNKRDDRYYDDYRPVDDRKSYDSYQEPYKKVDNKKENDRPVIIVKNKIPIPNQEKEKKKEPPMVLVNKEILFCDLIANGTDNQCFIEDEGLSLPGPNSDRYVQNCNDEQCEDIDASTFKIKIENANVFEGSEEGTKHNLDVRQFLVTEESDDELGVFIIPPVKAFCQDAGFDSGYTDILDVNEPNIVASCVLFEGDCSGTVQFGEQKECTVKNYVIGVGDFFI